LTVAFRKNDYISNVENMLAGKNAYKIEKKSINKITKNLKTLISGNKGYIERDYNKILKILQ